ncbi:MAG: hypothetical protein ACLU80_10170 [Dorea sp.]
MAEDAIRKYLKLVGIESERMYQEEHGPEEDKNGTEYWISTVPI